jgi:16S rRNA (adenine1518-N6/adenine1519-N6)-dimethyltransferase
MKKSRRHALGQHFLASRGVLAKIVEAIAPGPEDIIVEIGAGRGALTLALAARAGRVVAIEKDVRLIPRLRASVPGNVEVVHADALTFDFSSLPAPEPHGRLRAAGNLPYAVSSPLLFRILEYRSLFADCAFLLQREFARRVTSVAGSKAYAPLSILVQNSFETRIAFTVPPGAFSPPPAVTSALLVLRRRDAPVLDLPDEPMFEVFLRAAFAERRKRLLRNLERVADAADVAGALAAAGLSGDARAEELPAPVLARLFAALLPGLLFRKRPSARTGH